MLGFGKSFNGKTGKAGAAGFVNPIDAEGKSRPSSEESLRLTRAFFNIGDRKKRGRLIKLAESLSQK
jgi:hypothetical protein